MKPLPIALSAALCLGIAFDAQPDDRATALDSTVSELLYAQWDNREQLRKDPDTGLPLVSLTVEPTSRSGFSLWHVRVETDPDTAYEQTWAMESRPEYDGSSSLVPFYQFQQASKPQADAFDGAGWLALEACALRGEFTPSGIDGAAQGETCVAASMNMGGRRALLPVSVSGDGQQLQFHLSLRGIRTRIETRRAAPAEG